MGAVLPTCILDFGIDFLGGGRLDFVTRTNIIREQCPPNDDRNKAFGLPSVYTGKTPSGCNSPGITKWTYPRHVCCFVSQGNIDHCKSHKYPGRRNNLLGTLYIL